MFHILYQDSHRLIIQTHAGDFDKWGDDLYGEFNVALHVLDNNEHVLSNRLALLENLNKLNTSQPIQEIHWLNQVHGDNVVPIDKHQMSPPNADALITDKCGVGLSIMTADCVPIALFNDGTITHQSQIACIHAGWQGLTKGIIKNTAEQFNNKAIKAVIGACISQANYEMDNVLANAIIQSVIDNSLVDLSFDELYQQVVMDKPDGKCLMDIVKLTKLQLAHLDIELINHDVPCSYDVPNLYSYRQQTHAKKSATGRMAMIIAQF